MPGHPCAICWPVISHSSSAHETSGCSVARSVVLCLGSWRDIGAGEVPTSAGWRRRARRGERQQWCPPPQAAGRRRRRSTRRRSRPLGTPAPDRGQAQSCSTDAHALCLTLHAAACFSRILVRRRRLAAWRAGEPVPVVLPARRVRAGVPASAGRQKSARQRPGAFTHRAPQLPPSHAPCAPHRPCPTQCPGKVQARCAFYGRSGASAQAHRHGHDLRAPAVMQSAPDRRGTLLAHDTRLTSRWRSAIYVSMRSCVYFWASWALCELRGTDASARDLPTLLDPRPTLGCDARASSGGILTCPDARTGRRWAHPRLCNMPPASGCATGHAAPRPGRPGRPGPLAQMLPCRWLLAAGRRAAAHGTRHTAHGGRAKDQPGRKACRHTEVSGTDYAYLRPVPASAHAAPLAACLLPPTAQVS